MTGLENKLRAALREIRPTRSPTARRRCGFAPGQAPPGAARSGPASAAGPAGPPRWPPPPWSSRWSPPPWPWSAAGPGGPRQAGQPAAVPPYYVALTAPAYPDEYDGNATAAEVRATATGAVLAKVVPPKPYVLLRRRVRGGR